MFRAKSVENGESGRKFFLRGLAGGRATGRGRGSGRGGSALLWGFPQTAGKSSEPRWLSQAAGAFFSIECTKKRPKAFFYRMFLDVITGDTLAGKTFYAKKVTRSPQTLKINPLRYSVPIALWQNFSYLTVFVL